MSLGTTNKIWVGIRSVGRPQLIATLTCLYLCQELFEGIVVVGKIEDVSKKLLDVMSSKLKIRFIDGEYDMGEATSLLIKNLAMVKPSYTLFMDDDVLFRYNDIIKMLAKLWSNKLDILSMMQRDVVVTKYWENVWKKSGTVEFYFSLWTFNALSKLKDDDLKFLEKGRLGFEFYLLTWLTKKKKLKTDVMIYDDRPLHLFVWDKFSIWRNVPLKVWNYAWKRLIKVRTRSGLDKEITNWNAIVRKYNVKKT